MSAPRLAVTGASGRTGSLVCALAHAAEEFQLVAAACGGYHTRSHQLAQFNGCEAHSAGGTQHQKRLAGFEFRPLIKRIQRGSVSHRKAGRSHVIHTLRHPQEMRRVHN